MKFSVLTLFPDVITHYCNASIIGRGQEAGAIKVETINPRDFTTAPHRRVDDTPYGGGAGMVMMCQPLDDAYQSLQPLAAKRAVLLTTPVGPVFDHQKAKALAQLDQVVILCGHYEGIDHRIYDLIPELEPISLGEMVLTGGELPALCIIDAVSRHIPGVVQKADSVLADSFENGLLEHPHYTKPQTYKGFSVPDVLLSGHHEKITTWRRDQSLAETKRYRPGGL